MGDFIPKNPKVDWVVKLQIFFIFIPKIGEDEPILTCAYFSDGLVQPPTSKVEHQLNTMGPTPHTYVS